MVNSSRYIGSDSGYKMQADALTSLTNSTAQANTKVTETTQQALAGQIQANQRLMELQQAKAQADIQAASRPNQFTELAKAGLAVYQDIQKQQQQTEAKRVQQQQDIVNDVEYARVNDRLSELIADYQTNNWRNGQEAFKYEASKIVSGYVPKNKEQAAYYVKLLERTNEAYLKRTSEVGDKIEQEMQKTRASKVDIEKGKLYFEIIPQLSNIAYGGFDQQAKSSYEKLYQRLIQWKGEATQGGLSESDANKVISELLAEANKRYGDKLDRFTDTTAKWRGFQAGAAEANLLQQQYAAGQITYADMEAGINNLANKYPGFVPGQVARLGDEEAFKNRLLQTEQQRQQLIQQSGNQALAQAEFTDEEVKSLAARFYLGGEGRIKEIEATPGLKDNPAVIRAITYARQMQKFRETQNTTIADNQRLITQINQLNLSNAENYVSLVRSLIKPAEEMTPGERLQAELINRFLSTTPTSVAEATAAIQNGKQLTPEQRQQLQDGLNLQGAGIRKIQDSLLQQLQINNASLIQEFQDIQRLGLTNDTAILEQYAKNAEPLLQNLQQRLDQRRLEAQQQTQPTFGVQPNFNPSSSYAPVTDDRGNLVLVPRTQARRITIGGQEIVTPIVGDLDTVITSGYGRRTRPVPGASENHAGIDLELKKGNRAVSLVSGTVVHVGRARGYGNFVDILGDNGVLYRYAHTATLVKPGQRVTPGLPVAQSDGSGIGTAPHLHFEVRTPQFNSSGQYDINLNFGIQNTQNPTPHLAKLNAGDSNVLKPRGNTTAFRSAPTQRAPSDSTLVNQGVIRTGLYQRVGSSQPAPVSQRFTSQRPVNTGSVPGKVKVGQVEYDFGDNLGYAELAKQPQLMRAFHETAQRLGVPTAWIVDIVRQETGAIDPYKDHRSRNQNYGLFGFGNDSGIGDENFRRLRAGQIDGVGQLKLYEEYLKRNGWDKVRKQKGDNITIADFWAFTRLGWNARHKFWKTGDMSFKTSGNLTYADEIALLGKWVGRRYDLGGSNSRRERNAAVGNSNRYNSPLSGSLSGNGSVAPTRRPTAFPPSQAPAPQKRATTGSLGLVPGINGGFVDPNSPNAIKR